MKTPMKTHVTPKQVAQALGVSESSVKRWCDQGRIATERTAGGHRRLPVSGVIQFLRAGEHSLVRPEILSLPPAAKGRQSTLERSRTEIEKALEAGDEERLRTAGFNLYLAGTPAVEICDALITPAFHRLGEKWQHGALEVFQERRAVEICLKFLHELLLSVPPPLAKAPLAVGGTLEGDWYVLPTSMAELILREAGWRAQSFGASHPAETLEAAIREHRPRLFWLSVSWIGSREDFTTRFAQIYRTAVECGTALAVGGRALTAEVRQDITYSAHCESMVDLAAFARALGPSPFVPATAKGQENGPS